MEYALLLAPAKHDIGSFQFDWSSSLPYLVVGGVVVILLILLRAA